MDVGLKYGCCLFPEQLHILCVRGVPGHVLSRSLASELRVLAGIAAGTWHKACKQSFLSCLKKNTKDNKGPRLFSRSSDTQGLCYLSPRCRLACGAGFFSLWQYVLLGRSQEIVGMRNQPEPWG